MVSRVLGILLGLEEGLGRILWQGLIDDLLQQSLGFYEPPSALLCASLVEHEHGRMVAFVRLLELGVRLFEALLAQQIKALVRELAGVFATSRHICGFGLSQARRRRRGHKR